MAPITFGYWKIRGLGAAARMMLEYGKADYEDVQYADGEKWFGEDKPELIKKNPLMNLPYLVDGDVVITQSNAIYQYLGDKFGLTPSDPAAKLMDSQVLFEVFDIRTDHIELVYPFRQVCRDEEEFKARKMKILEEVLAGYYKKIDAVLAGAGTTFVGGSKPAASDFHLFEMIDQHEMLAKQCDATSPVAAFPALSKMYKAFRELPELASYFESDAYKLPVNNKLGNCYWC